MRSLRVIASVSVGVVLLVAGLRFVIDSNPLSGPVVLSLSQTHGIHANDGLTLVMWFAAIRLIRAGLEARVTSSRAMTLASSR